MTHKMKLSLLFQIFNVYFCCWSNNDCQIITQDLLSRKREHTIKKDNRSKVHNNCLNK